MRKRSTILYAFINLEYKTLDRYHASKMDPDRPRRLLAPTRRPAASPIPTVHIAGTKGKGSVAAMCASALRAAGLRSACTPRRICATSASASAC